MRAYIANTSIGAFIVQTTAELFGSRRRVAILALIAVLAGLIGPFGTSASPFAPGRYVYWALVVFGTVWPVHLIFTACEDWSRRSRVRHVFWVPIASVVAAIPVTAMVAAIALGFGSPSGMRALADLFGQCVLVIMAIGTVVHLIESAAATPAIADAPPAILRRLPGAKRGRLIRLTAQDHYVEIVTDRGSALVPMRLRDAIAETEPIEGAQVHRSHWVAADAVMAGRSIDGSWKLRLTDGSTVPVGRTFRQRAEEAGVLV